MAVQKDIPMNQFGISSNIRYLYGEDASGTQVKLDLSRYILMNKLEGTDANDIIENGTIICMNNVANVPFDYGTLICFSNGIAHIVQQFFPAINNSELYIRQYSSNKWSAWIKL